MAVSSPMDELWNFFCLTHVSQCQTVKYESHSQESQCISPYTDNHNEHGEHSGHHD